jgi:phosphinothricin acetyltransferase
MADIRPGEHADLPQVTALYDHYIRHTPTTFDIDPWTAAQREEWFTHYAPSGRHRFLVAVDGDRVLGYATTSPFRTKQAYETSVETSVYLLPDEGGRGLGSALYAALFDAVAEEDIHRAYAGITTGNPASEALHTRFGFRPVGVFEQVGRKLGRYWDVLWMERSL